MRNLFLILVLLGVACLPLGAAVAEPAAADANAGVVTDPAAVKVFSTEKGAKYHTKECTYGKIEVTLAKALTDGDTPCARCKPPVYDAAKITVFASDTGRKYHAAGCRYGKDKTTLKEAVEKGLEPCAQCKPPVLWTPPPPGK